MTGHQSDSFALTKITRTVTSSGIWYIPERGIGRRDQDPKLKQRIAMKNGWVQYTAADAPTVSDLRLLLAVQRLTVEIGQELVAKDPAPNAAALRAQLELEGEAGHWTATTVSCTGRTLMKAMDLEPGGNTWENLKSSLRRLSDISVSFEFNIQGRTVGSTGGRVMKVTYGEHDDEMQIQLHPKIAAPLLGDYSLGYVSIPDEAWKDLSDVALLVAVDLARICSPGESAERLIENITRMIWPIAVGRTSEWERSKKVLMALEEVAQFKGWSVKVDGKCRKVTIRRLKVGEHVQAA